MARTKSATSQIINLNMFRSIAGLVNDTDAWLSSVDERESVFERMRDDGRIESLIQDRKTKVLQMYGTLTPSGNSRLDKACDRLLPFNTFYKLNNILLNAVPFGIAACEILWKFSGGFYIPYGFVPIPRTALSFPHDESLAFGTPVITSQNIPLDDKLKFIVHRNDDGELSRWGRPTLRAAYVFWKFKRLGVRFWAQAAEIVGAPSILAIFDARTEAEATKTAQSLTAALRGWESGSSGALGNVREVQVVSSQINDFNTIVECCNTEIAYALTAQSLSTNEAQYGTRAQSDTHTQTYNEIIRGDAYALQQSDQQLVDAFTALNFPGETPPSYDIDSSDFAGWDVIRDAVDRGIPVSLSALYKKIHLPKPSDGKDAFVKPQQGFGFSDDARDDFFFKK